MERAINAFKRTLESEQGWDVVANKSVSLAQGGRQKPKHKNNDVTSQLIPAFVNFSRVILTTFI